MAGQSTGALERNVINKLIGILKNSQKIKFGVKANSSKHYFDVFYMQKRNRFYYFGGTDADSFITVQGLTAAGCYFDEVALLNEEFVDVCTSRCSIDGSKYWYNCNPRHPLHWFKTKMIDDAKAMKALVLHFVMDDNPSLSEAKKQEYKNNFKGVFYRRYINGEWCVAEGVIYENWKIEEFDYHRMLLAKDYYRRDKYIKLCGLDFGYNHPTAVAASMYDKEGNTLYVYKEVYRRNLLIKDIYDEIKKQDLHKLKIVGDSEDPRMIEELRNFGLNIASVNKGSVISGIQRLQSMNIIVHPSCKNAIAEFNSYSWKNDKKTGMALDEPVKENDDFMDALRYSALDIGGNFNFG